MPAPGSSDEIQPPNMMKEVVMTSIKALAVVTALFATSGFIGTADAQQPGSGSPRDQWSDQGYNWMMGPNGMMGSRGMGYGMMGWSGQGGAMCGMMTGHIEGRLAYLKTELKITDAQATLWDAYANAARANTQVMTTHCTAMMGSAQASGATLPDRLDQHEQLMTAQLEAIRNMNKALKPLYAALTDNQKQALYQLPWSPMGMMW
jgi:hypothetical protein